jgi:hypothetical protein
VHNYNGKPHALTGVKTVPLILQTDTSGVHIDQKFKFNTYKYSSFCKECRFTTSLQSTVLGQSRDAQIPGTWWTKFSTVALKTVSMITAAFLPA